MKSPKKGVNIRKLGEDIKKNGEVLKKGVYLRPAEIGLIASIGISRVKVFKKLKVSFFSTGDEVVKAGNPSNLDKSMIVITLQFNPC